MNGMKLLAAAAAMALHARPALADLALAKPGWSMDMLGLTQQHCILPVNASSSPASEPPARPAQQQPEQQGSRRRLQWPPPPPLQPGPRLAWVAQPAGKPPAAGWPLYFQFVTDGYSAAGGTQCTADGKTAYPGHMRPVQVRSRLPPIMTTPVRWDVPAPGSHAAHDAPLQGQELRRLRHAAGRAHAVPRQVPGQY